MRGKKRSGKQKKNVDGRTKSQKWREEEESEEKVRGLRFQGSKRGRERSDEKKGTYGMKGR